MFDNVLILILASRRMLRERRLNGNEKPEQ